MNMNEGSMTVTLPVEKEHLITLKSRIRSIHYW